MSTLESKEISLEKLERWNDAIQERWNDAIQEIDQMKYAPTLFPVCVAILRTDWDRTDPRGFLNMSPGQVESFLLSFSVRNFAYDEHTIGVRKTFCHIVDAFQHAAAQRARQPA